LYCLHKQLLSASCFHTLRILLYLPRQALRSLDASSQKGAAASAALERTSRLLSLRERTLKGVLGQKKELEGRVNQMTIELANTTADNAILEVRTKLHGPRGGLFLFRFFFFLSSGSNHDVKKFIFYMSL
jgi:hypothetical protein